MPDLTGKTITAVERSPCSLVLTFSDGTTTRIQACHERSIRQTYLVVNTEEPADAR